MNSKIDYSQKLQERAFNDIIEKILSELPEGGKLTMNKDDIEKHIMENLDKYLSKPEQDQLVRDQLGVYFNYELISNTLAVIIKLTALSISMGLEKALNSEEFIGNNPFSPIKNPHAFLLYKFFDEKHGVKLNVKYIDMDLGGSC